MNEVTMRRKLFWAIAIFQLCAVMPLLEAESRFEKNARKKHEIAGKVAWPSHEPIEFMLRRGTHSEDIMETYDRQHAPDNVQLMSDAGETYSRLHFYKGLGLDVEMPAIRRTQQMAEQMHKLGMKVSVYVGGTMFVETFYRETPEAVQWEQRDQLNHPVYYIETQTYRHFACFNEPKYDEYVKRVLKIAVEQVKADQIFFDNVFLLPEPKSCRCPRCIHAFKEFLKQRYSTKAAAFRRFGYADPDQIVVNDWDIFNGPDALTAVNDPILQEWMRFRCETVARHCANYYDYVKSLNPKISVGFNLKGIYGLNRIWRNAIYHPLLAGKIDFSPFDVGGMDAHIDAQTGALIAEIRSFKMARTLDFSFETGGEPLEQAVTMAFNPQKYIDGYGWQGSPGHTSGQDRSFSPEAEFYREYSERYYTGTENVADVAVLRSWPSMAYSIVETSVPTVLMEQVLIQHKIPFDIIFDEQMDKIGRYRAVILPGQESLSQAWVDKLTAYAQNGGTVVFTGNTAQYNDWRETRRTNPLLARMGARSVTALGKGKLVYIPEIVPATASTVEARTIGVAGDETASSASPARGGTFAAPDWVLPKNHAAIRDAILTNLSQPLSITSEAPLTTVMEMVNRAKSNETIVHFVNFDAKGPTAPFAVRLKSQFAGRKVASVQYFTPENDDPKKLEFTERGGEIAFTAPPVKRYSMTVVSYQ
jgi:hypothetical protein